VERCTDDTATRVQDWLIDVEAIEVCSAIDEVPHSRRRPPAADIGGDEAGPVDTLDHGMKFWERQANALRSVIQRNQIARTDELRRAAEDLGERYAKLEYFERTTLALRTILIEKGLITEQELKARMAEVRARFDVPDEMESPIKKGARR